MWVSRKKLKQLENCLDECKLQIEELEKKLSEETDKNLCTMAKRIISDPDGVQEEIRGIESLENFIQDFLDS